MIPYRLSIINNFSKTLTVSQEIMLVHYTDEIKQLEFGEQQESQRT